MTLEDLISNLKNDKLDLEIKLCSLCDFYFDSSSYQENAKIIANAHDNNQINLISLATQVVDKFNKDELIDIGQFEHVFFNLVVLTNRLDFPELINIVLNFEKIFENDRMRFHYLQKIAQKNFSYAEYLFNFIVNNLDTHYDKLGVAIACLTIFDPIKTKEFILNHFNSKEKNIDSLLNAVRYLEYASTTDADQILDKINYLINKDHLNASQFSQILEIITYIFLQHNNLESHVINTIELILSKIGSTDISEKAANLLFFEGAKVSKLLKQYFYQMIINAENISHQVCNNLSLTIENQSTDEDLRELIEIIEQLLLKHQNISIKNFYTYYIRKNSDLLNKIVTRWFLSKKKRLWESASDIIISNQIKSLHVDISWVKNFKEEDSIFLTKKAIGWLYIHEELILNFIIDILNYIKNPEIILQILDLAFQHIIINYEPQHVAFFFDLNNYPEEETKNKIIELNTQHEAIYTKIKQANDLKELACPLEHSRLIQYKRHRENEKINRSADAQSAFADLFTKRVMLYGETYIHITNTENNEITLQENVLSSFSYSMSLPLQYFTDPVLLEYQRLFFMNEGGKE
ncbi:hypothetical protein [Acinetobacter baumannii]|uniref:hypothetical protein n=1 Tax=Acinetobacter baumannii TaxID=470 RepID=UPI0020BE246B|nr:hypothetical protein [Acinetobacter baumannii]MCL6176985.1 hypothetical protein [Acinetobacter baumannii]MCL6180447.1 hypothetical protein [Acinetobacter baumannii]MCL6187237.1 hypothetical protein [Acinetobacter baumannii]MCL6208520.1 hypothetical protein [Acinetobacter baumannii]MCL6211978.1 hypothetical protein [Acinetobacter baumannii]